MNKFGVSEDKLKCGIQEPISKTARENLLKSGEKACSIHNNCSGKHTAMLLICKELGYSIEDYKDFEHPLSDFIINHVCELCEVSKDNIVISKDGCGLPVIATTLESLGRGFLNLFCNPKYEKIKNAYRAVHLKKD